MNIAHISYHLPKNKLSLSQLCDLNELSREEADVFVRVMGLESVPRDKTRTPYDNICHVIKQLLQEYAITPDKVRYIFLSHTADYIAPFEYHLSDKIKTQFQFQNALCFGSVINKCATPFHFFNLAHQCFRKISNNDLILIINADTAFTSILKTIPGSTILGDSASAIALINKGDDHQYIDTEIMVDDRFSHGVFGSPEEKLLFQCVYYSNLSHIIKTLLDRNQLTLSQIKLILPHNVNTLSWMAFAKQMQIPIDKIYLQNVSTLGHCFGSDPFINLQDAVFEKRIKKNDYYLMVTVGLGATFAAMLFQY